MTYRARCAGRRTLRERSLVFETSTFGRAMSRNLSRVDCYFCSGRVVTEESPRPIRRDECGVYFDCDHGYEGLLVAGAHCYDCNAKYLAWADETTIVRHRSWHRRVMESGHSHFDLSFRSTFNDEPGPEDLPDRESFRAWRDWPRCDRCGLKVYSCYGCQCPTRPA